LPERGAQSLVGYHKRGVVIGWGLTGKTFAAGIFFAKNIAYAKRFWAKSAYFQSCK